MRTLLLLLLAIGPVLALDNSVTVYETTGAVQTYYPLTIHRIFAQGDFPAGYYPQPRVAAVAASYWQVDVDTTWPDGSAQRVYISLRPTIPANGNIVVDFVKSTNACHLGSLSTCQAAAMTQAQMLDYNTGGGTGSWSATWYGTMNSVQYSASARAILTAGYWRWRLRGPIVSGVIVEDRTTALNYDFGWRYNTGTANWEAPPSNSYKSLHPLFELRFYPDPDGAGGVTAWGGVSVDAMLLNASSTRRQRLYPLDLMVRTGTSEATTAYSVTSKSYHARSRRHWAGWSNTAPGDVVVDYGLEYMIYTRLLASYDYHITMWTEMADQSLTNYTTNLAGDEAQWCGNSTTMCASWLKNIQGVGTRADIALVPLFYLHYLSLMGNDGVTVAKKLEIWQKMVLGMADAAANAPIHYFETGTGMQFYSTYDSTDAFGRVGSISARTGGWIAGGTGEDTYMPPVCSASPCDGRGYNGIPLSTNSWQAYASANFTSHAPSFYAMPAMLTGSYYYLQGVQYEAAYAIATIHACTRGSATSPPYYAEYCRFNSWGIAHYESNLRENAWVTRNLALAAILTPDAEAIEKAYFKAKLLNNVRFVEGIMLITSGAAPPSDPTCASFVRSDGAAASPTFDLWCAGRDYWNNWPGGIPSSNPLRIATWGNLTNSLTNGWIDGARYTTLYWNHYRAVVYGWLVTSGAVLDVDGAPAGYHVKNGFAIYYAGHVLHSANGAMSLRDIQGPLSASGGVPQDFDDVEAAYQTTFTLASTLNAGQLQVDLTTKDTGASNRGGEYLKNCYLKIDDEYVRLNGIYTNDSPAAGNQRLGIQTDGRGNRGTMDVTHTAGTTAHLIWNWWEYNWTNAYGGYHIVARAALAMLFDADQLGSYNHKTAYRAFDSAMPQKHIFTGNPMWAFEPRESITDLTATGSLAAADFTWTAPSGAACKVYVGSSEPSSSYDTTDQSSTAPSRHQSFAAAGLSAGTNYYRITCGTARVRGTVTVQ